jgi:predicted AAA+ superfamily ATPase
VERVLEVCGKAMSNLYRVAPTVAETIPHARDIIGFRSLVGPQQCGKTTLAKSKYKYRARWCPGA